MSPPGDGAGAAMRRTVLAGAGAALAGAPLLWLQPARAAAPPSGVHLGYGADAQRSMTLSWGTGRSVRRPLLELGTDRALGRRVVADSGGSKGVGTVYHHVALDDLEPGTRYHYRLSHHGADPVEGTFTTAPAGPRPFRFVTFGDMGVNAAAAEHVALIRRWRPDLAFVVGDLCYADTSGGHGGGPSTQHFATWDRWLGQIQPSAAAVPWMTVVGNHEMETGNGELGYDGYLDRFRPPADGPVATAYSFVHGNVGFVALDGNDASYEIDRNRGWTGGAQDRWLEQRLRAMRARSDLDFIVVGFHHCMYCTNQKHGSDHGPRERWGPLFDAFEVDLVVNGHNHCYERTHPVRAGVAVLEAPVGAAVDAARGTTYLTAGGAGATEYPIGGGPVSYVTVEGGLAVPETTDWSAVALARHSVAFVDVTPRAADGTATMRLRGVMADGTVIDSVTLARRTGPDLSS